MRKEELIMTDKDLKRLNRQEVLQILLDTLRENEALQQKLAKVTEQYEQKEIAVSNCGSMAEASLMINDVFAAADKAAEQYLYNIQTNESRCREILEEAQAQAEKIVADAEAQAADIRAAAEADAEKQAGNAKQKSEQYWNEVSSRLERFYEEHRGLREMLSTRDNR